MPGLIQDDKGNYSSMRVIMLFGGVVFLLTFALFVIIVFEALGRKSEPINYSGIALLFTAMVVEIMAFVCAKVWQKKIENTDKS
jgi:quinol-cytochrome oxidoreductase complex cytochrome b subunit